MGFGERVRLSLAPPTSSASTRRCRRSRTTARAISISAALARSRRRGYDALEPVQWPVREGDAAGDARFFADGGFFTPDRKARFIAPEPPALRDDDQRPNIRCAQHRPRARPVAHHDAHRPEPAARRASRRSRSSKSIRPTPRRIGLATAASRASRPRMAPCMLKVAPQRRPAARLAVRADPLERRNRSSARVGDLVAPQTDPYSGQPEAKATPAAIAPVAFRLSRLCADARAARAAGRHLVGAGRAAGGVGYAVRHQRRAEALARARAELFAAGRARRIRRSPARHLSRRGLRRRPARWRAVPRPGRRAAAMGRVKACSKPRLAIAAPHALSGRDGLAESGPVICACFGVGLDAIHEALASRQARECRGDRQGAARRHQLRLVPAGTEEDRGP